MQAGRQAGRPAVSDAMGWREEQQEEDEKDEE